MDRTPIGTHGERRFGQSLQPNQKLARNSGWSKANHIGRKLGRTSGRVVYVNEKFAQDIKGS
jgi:hypothetical protein